MKDILAAAAAISEQLMSIVPTHHMTVLKRTLLQKSIVIGQAEVSNRN